MPQSETNENEMSMAKKNDNKPEPTQEQAPSAAVQVLPLPPGLYLFSVTAAAAAPPQGSNQLALPAVQVSLGPGVRADQVEFMTGPSMHGAWLYAPGDMLVTKVNGGGATLVMTSMRGPGGEVLAVKVERLEARAEVVAVDKNGAMPALAAAKSAEAASGDDVPIKIAAHIRTRGDMSFAEAPWAGRVAPGLWIESFSVLPLTRFKPQDIEYKGLTGSGFETPWITEDKMCGTKGMAVPLVGFAVRLKGTAAGGYDCEYSGYFQSGLTVGPLRNGAPCRSTTANDPLEGIALRIVKRSIRRQSANRS